jgi:allantoinase
MVRFFIATQKWTRNICTIHLMIDVVIKSKRVITPGGTRPGNVLIGDGKIVAVEDDYDGAAPVVDIGNTVLMPGIVDPHVHINEPGRTAWEGFDTATKSALAGGISTLIDMPLNSSPVTTTGKAFDQKVVAASGRIHVNCGFWGGIIPGNENEIETLVAKGVRGFKAFLTHSGIAEFPNVTEADLHKAMPVIAKFKLPLLVHCEISTPTGIAVTHPRSYKQYLASRPAKWETDAVALMIELCEKFKCAVHIVHVSSGSSIALLSRAKQMGLPITAETAQHYLYFQAEQIPDGQTVFKCAPPIRDAKNCDQLWEALGQGIINFVATDHSPCTPSLKEMETGDLMKAWGGIASLQLSLPVLWTAARKRGFAPGDIARWLCQEPAVLPGLQERKGKIAKGFDADMVAWNPEQSFTVTPEMLHHRHKQTPYIGEILFGKVEQVWLAGEKVYADEKFLHLNKGQIIN